MRRVPRRGFQRRHHDILDLLRGHRRGSTRPRIIHQTIQAMLQKP